MLTQGARSVDAYFPPAVWYDYYTHERFVSEGTTITLDAPLDLLPLHIRGGHVVPMQLPAYTIAESRQQPFQLVVALDGDDAAAGSLYLDDGCVAALGAHRVRWAASHSVPRASLFPRQRCSESLQVQAATRITYAAANRRLEATGTFGYTTVPTLNRVTVLGVSPAPTQVVLDGAAVPFSYDGDRLVLAVDGLSVSMNAPFTLAW